MTCPRSVLASACLAVFTFFAPNSHASERFNFDHCNENETCTVELPNAVCGDGSQMFVNITARTGATKLFIYLEGGGACWDSVTCGCLTGGACAGGLASTLTRPDPATVSSGWHKASEAANPIGFGYNLVEVPYCTGDLFIGNRVHTFGRAEQTTILRQVGYHDLAVALAAAHKRFPAPESIVFMGSSAGGLGAAFNVAQVHRFFPDSPLSILSDSGVPFKTPFVHRVGIDTVIGAWNTVANLPSDYYAVVPGPLDFSGVLRYNARRYPDDRFGLIASYDDYVMNTFAQIVGTDYGLMSVRLMLNDLAAHDLGARQKVFYVEGVQHTFHETPVREPVADGVNLGHWLTSMLDGAPDWANQRAEGP